MTSTNTNAWLRGQRKGDLLELAETVGLKGTSSMKKSDLEDKLDEYLAENQSQWQSETAFAPYYSSRARNATSPVKKDAPPPASDLLKVVKKRISKTAEQIAAAVDPEEPLPPSNALVTRTPARSLSLAQRIPLPSTPREVVRAVDRRTVALRKRATSMYAESGITDATHATRRSLSTVTSIVLSIVLFETYHLRKDLLPDRYAFTFPAIALLGTSERPVEVPDLFLLLTAGFWIPALTWAMTSLVVPALFGYFFNLSDAHSHTPAGRLRANHKDYSIDPLAFSVAKALLTYVVFHMGATFGGWVDQDAVARLDAAIYGGWRGVVVGCAIGGLASVYDAVLQK